MYATLLAQPRTWVRSSRPVVPSALPLPTPASSARNVPVRRAYPRPRACRSGVPVGDDSCRPWPVVPITRIEASPPCGTVATPPGCAVVPLARIKAGPPCGTVRASSGGVVVPLARIKAEPYTKYIHLHRYITNIHAVILSASVEICLDRPEERCGGRTLL
jgi:hypothetical protein